MRPFIPIRPLSKVVVSWLPVLSVMPLNGQDVEPGRQTSAARIHIQQGTDPVLALEGTGERIKGDGRLRCVGSIGDSGADAHAIRWTFLCDPNPHGGASIEGRFDVEGPFDGWVMIEMPVNPVVDGPVALQLAGSLRGRTCRPGVVFSVARQDHALIYHVDDAVIGHYGRGPFTMQRAQAGATAPRLWSTGEKGDRVPPVLLAGCHDRLAVRLSGRIPAGAEAVFTARMRLVGKPEDFIVRETEPGRSRADGVIPRVDDAVSISVSGASRGRSGRSLGGARPNKPAAVVRPVPAAGEPPGRSAVEE
ncbi:MAG: hypothetical protein VX641_05910 [Planctomycetota bacterium]|nr:hypothetical protein [Planctomycetota bacterium]